jgi:predicted transcriptional regulator
MAHYFIQNMDPSDMSAMFSTEDAMDPFEDPIGYDQKEEYRARIYVMLPRIPDQEADMLELYFFRNKTQMEIAKIFGVTQAAVSYRIKRSLQRLRFLMDMPILTREQIAHDMQFFSDFEIAVLQEMYDCTCQSSVSERLGKSQNKVRYHFQRCILYLLSKVKDPVIQDVRFDPYGQILKNISTLQHVDDDAYCEFAHAPLEYVYKMIRNDKVSDEPEFSDLSEEFVTHLTYFWMFERIKIHFNILQEIKLPKWHGRSTRILG